MEGLSTKTMIVGSALLAAGLIPVTQSVRAQQVLAQEDFQSSTVGMTMVHSYLYSGTNPPSVTATVFNDGNPQGNVLRLSVDSSAVAGDWRAFFHWQPTSQYSYTGPYDAPNTFLNFDAFVSELKPFSLQLGFPASPSDVRVLQADITPNTANSWISFSLPLSSFAVRTLTGNPLNIPTEIQFSISGDPADPTSSWGFDSGNVLMLDNLSYSIVPEPSDLILIAIGSLLLGSIPLGRRLRLSKSQICPKTL